MPKIKFRFLPKIFQLNRNSYFWVVPSMSYLHRILVSLGTPPPTQDLTVGPLQSHLWSGNLRSCSTLMGRQGWVCFCYFSVLRLPAAHCLLLLGPGWVTAEGLATATSCLDWVRLKPAAWGGTAGNGKDLCELWICLHIPRGTLLSGQCFRPAAQSPRSSHHCCWCGGRKVQLSWHLKGVPNIETVTDAQKREPSSAWRTNAAHLFSPSVLPHLSPLSTSLNI